MTAPPYSLQTSKKNHANLTLRKRGVLVLLICCIQMIYIPTSNWVTGGIEPKLPIDIFPIWSIWVVPYLLCYVLWSSSFAWIILKTEDRVFYSFIAACILTFGVAILIFIFFPTYVKAATLEGTDVFTSLLHFIHDDWGRYDAFPSGHIYITTLLALFFSRWYPRSKALWILILMIVSLSTLFTGQHYLLDVIGGYILAWAGYRFGLWWAGSTPEQKRTRGENLV